MRARMGLVVAGLVLTGARPAPAPPSLLMFPSYVMMRGGGVATPVVITHAGAVGNAFLDAPTNVSRDTIAMLYGSIRLHQPAFAERVRQRPFIEVAEWFGTRPRTDSAGRALVSDFEKANHHSRIYLPSGVEPALWENPVVAPGRARRVLRARRAGAPGAGVARLQGARAPLRRGRTPRH